MGFSVARITCLRRPKSIFPGEARRASSGARSAVIFRSNRIGRVFKETEK